MVILSRTQKVAIYIVFYVKQKTQILNKLLKIAHVQIFTECCLFVECFTEDTRQTTYISSAGLFAECLTGDTGQSHVFAE